jgi:hypothetical protein
LLANQDYEVVLRGASVAKNMVTVGGDATAEKVLATEVMEVLQALIFKAKRRLYLIWLRQPFQYSDPSNFILS